MAFKRDGIIYEHRTADVAKHFGVIPNTVQRWCRVRQIPFFRIGGRYWFNLQEVEKSFEARETPLD